MRTVLKGLLATGVILAFIGTTHAFDLTLSGGRPGGLWAALGQAIDTAVRKDDPSSGVAYVSSSSGFANAAILDRGNAHLAIAHDAELARARQGKPPFDAPIESLRAIAYLYTWSPVQILVRKEFAETYNLRSVVDLATERAPARIGLNAPGNVSTILAEEMLGAIGATPESIARWGGRLEFGVIAEQARKLAEGELDVVIDSAFLRYQPIEEAVETIPVTLLDMDALVVETMMESLGTQPFIIPAGTYPGQEEDIQTVALGAVLVASSSLPDSVAYAVAKAIFENHELLAGVHPAMSPLSPSIMASQKALEFHPGARRYLEEVGLLAGT